jgi:hypothetical protein
MADKKPVQPSYTSPPVVPGSPMDKFVKGMKQIVTVPKEAIKKK